MKGFSWIGSVIVGILCVAVLPVDAQERIGTEDVAASPNNPYTPPACVPGVPFADITCTTGFDPWIEQFGADGITAGCGGGDYCPGTPVTRDQMAVFIEKAMRGTSAWSPGNLGNANTGLGANALFNNSAYAYGNTAVGINALQTQSFANGNVGYASYNTAVGVDTLAANQPDGGNAGEDGIHNTALGAIALEYNTTGYYNTATGVYALGLNTQGNYNAAIGANAGSGNATGSKNTFLGTFSGPNTGGQVDSTAIGFNAVADASYHIQVGDNNVTQIGGPVGWSNLSDVRAKTNIQDLDLGLDFVMALRPVSFTLKQGNGRTDLGFVAQDVETLLGDGYNVLGIGADKDRTLSLRYTDFIAPMVKAIQEQQAQIEDQKTEIAALKARLTEVEELKAEVKSLMAGLKVAAKTVRP